MVMKRYLFLCLMMTLSMNMMGQIVEDPNYSTVFLDSFEESGRYWQNFKEHPNLWWRAYSAKSSHAVTLSPSEHQVYRPQNCVFDVSDSTMKLISEYAGHQLQCWEYNRPINYTCDTSHHSLYYYSGFLETRSKFLYGYFEIKCKLPFHPGSFPAFWLWDADGAENYYEEIDIMEYSYGYKISNGTPTKYSTALLYNKHGNVCPYGEHNHKVIVRMPENNDITHWHTYGCEWLPDRITWYLDGEVVNEFYAPDSIPCHPLTLIANYAIDNKSLDPISLYPSWTDSGVVAIDYIQVRQLDWDCSSDEVISSQSDLDGFDYAVKKSVIIDSAIADVKVRNTDTVCFRVTDSFEVTGPFEVENGARLSVIKHACNQ